MKKRLIIPITTALLLAGCRTTTHHENQPQLENPPPSGDVATDEAGYIKQMLQLYPENEGDEETLLELGYDACRIMRTGTPAEAISTLTSYGNEDGVARNISAFSSLFLCPDVAEALIDETIE